MDVFGKGLFGERALEGNGGRDGIGRSGERGERAVTFTLRTRHSTAMCLRDLGCELVVSRNHLRHRLRMRFPEWRGPFDVGEHEGHHTRRQRGLPRALESFDELRRRCRPARCVAIERAAQHAVEALRELGRDAVPHDRRVRLRLDPRQEPRDRAREQQHVVGNRRRRSVPKRRGTEHEHRAVLGGDDDVGDAHVAVHDTRPLRVEVIERRCDVGKPAEHGRDRQARVAALGQYPRRRRALDPVDDQHVAIVEQHVVPHGGHRGVGLEPEEEPPFFEEWCRVVAGCEPGDLETDGATVAAIDALATSVLAPVQSTSSTS